MEQIVAISFQILICVLFLTTFSLKLMHQNFWSFKHFHSISDTVCPTRYQTRHFFNNSNTNADIPTKFEQEYVRCVRNEKECVCSVCL